MADRHPSEGFQVACVQWQPGPDPEANLHAMATRVPDAAQQGATLVVFPEYSFRHVSPPLPEWTSHHTALDGEWVRALADLAGESHVTVIAGISESAGSDKPYNTQVVVNGSGLVGYSRKIHLYDAFSMSESDLFTPAPAEPAMVFEVGGMTVGVQTCYDLRFPEVTRRLVDAGAEVLVVPSQWVSGPDKAHQWRTLLVARAIEAQVWVVASDHPEPTGVGTSLIIDPRGRIAAEAGYAEQIISAHLDSQVVREVREKNPMAKARRFVVDWG